MAEEAKKEKERDSSTDPRKEEPDADEDMNTDGVDGGGGEDAHATPLKDGPAKKQDIRVGSPQRKPATRRKAHPFHEEEPDTKKIILDEPSDEDDAHMDPEDLSTVNERRTDQFIVT